MQISGLHILLTYQCTFECDHCFVWGSPWQSGTLTFRDIRRILRQAKALGSVESVYFEGGEPFLYYAILVQAVRLAVRMGFRIGLVSNAFWATDVPGAREWLRPFAGLLEDLSVSSDLLHYDQKLSRQAQNAREAAKSLGIRIGLIEIALPEVMEAQAIYGQLPEGESGVMYRGRAAERLVSRATLHPWAQFTACPHEDLREPGRVHLDPFGYVHICQGIALGNAFQTPLSKICASYVPDHHPIVGPLLEGGPAALVRRYDLPHAEGYADACHLCYEARRALRPHFPETLMPDQMYGVN